jgi:hypothetical protein
VHDIAARAIIVDMRSKLNRLLCFLSLALPVSAQLDLAQLRISVKDRAKRS